MIKVTDDNIKEIVRQGVKENPFVDLNDLDISEVTHLSYLFCYLDFRGDISRWNTSNVLYMTGVFFCCTFDGDLGGWDVSKCIDMSYMFYENKRFNQDISHWIIDKNCSYDSIFEGSIYDKALPKGMDPQIAFGRDYDKRFKQKMEKTIKAL